MSSQAWLDRLTTAISKLQNEAKKFLANPASVREIACLRHLQLLRECFDHLLWRGDNAKTAAGWTLYCVVCPFAVRLLLATGYPSLSASMASFLALFLRLALACTRQSMSSYSSVVADTNALLDTLFHRENTRIQASFVLLSDLCQQAVFHHRCLEEQENRIDTRFVLKLLANMTQYDPELSALEVQTFKTSGITPDRFGALKDTSLAEPKRPASFKYVYDMMKNPVRIADFTGLLQLLQRCYCPNHFGLGSADALKAVRKAGKADLPTLSYKDLWKALLVS